jgi:hypothetical protein
MTAKRRAKGWDSKSNTDYNFKYRQIMKHKQIIFIAIVILLGLTFHSNGQEGSRQIHLDFHTSEAIPNIGALFSKKQFQEALKLGNVNSINIFAKGHHSWFYFPTETGKMHPGLDFDLMGAQIEACKEIGVKVNIYFTVGWSANDAKLHPEWALLDKNGTNEYREQLKTLGKNDPVRGWEYLPPEGEYAQLIYRQLEELVKKYKVDGLWFDIVKAEQINYNQFSLNEMKKLGINVDDLEAVTAYNNEKYYLFLKKSSEIVMQYLPEATIYYNGTTATYVTANTKTFKYGFFNYNTKHDLEDLPTAWGGYDIFPYRSKYFANTGKEIVAMSGKFHKAWGEFGGFKDKEAILFEAASMIAFGANVNFGDQLHPSGLMDLSTYENIGYAYDYVEKIEQYGIGGISKSETGLYIGEDVPANEGTTQMLLERQINFNVVNTLKDWSEIKVLVVTSDGILKTDLPKVQDFINRGGKVLCMGKGIFVDGKPVIDIGAELIGNARFDVDYTLVNEPIAKDLVESPFLNYNPAVRIKPNAGTEVLARIREPYFSRTIDHYSSHANTPYILEDADHPAAIRNGNIIYIAHDLDKQYHKEGARLHRDLFINALNLLRENPMVTAEMPSMGRVNLLQQADKNRYVVHLLYASPIQRGNVRVVEDLVPLFNTKIEINLPENIKSATLIPSMQKIEMIKKDGKITFVVPEFTCHTGIVLEY